MRNQLPQGPVDGSRRREGEEVAQAPWGPSVCPGQRRALVPHGTTSPSISVFPHGALVPAAPSHPLFVLNPPNPEMSTWIVVSWTHWGPNQICLEQKLRGEKITNLVKAGWQEVAGAPSKLCSQPARDAAQRHKQEMATVHRPVPHTQTDLPLNARTHAKKGVDKKTLKMQHSNNKIKFCMRTSLIKFSTERRVSFFYFFFNTIGLGLDFGL